MAFDYDAVTTLGEADFRYVRRAVGIRQRDRLFHGAILGQTGTGKSTLLFNMIMQDALHGRGFCLIDPHGDIARSVSEALTVPHIYWDVADPECPIGYNPLTFVAAAYRPLIASGLIETLKKQWQDAWGPRMEHLLRFAILALLETPGTDISQIVRLFVDKQFRWRIVDRVTDDQVRQFWRKEFGTMNHKNAGDGFAPIANKLGAFMAHPVVRKSVCRPEQPLRLRRLMDDRVPLVVNLAKGRLGSDVADVLGGLLVSSLMLAGFSRHDVPEKARIPFFLYVDEFHTFATTSFATMLSEVRKFGLGVLLANQYVGQQDREVLEAILGNVGSILAFRLGVLDAGLMVQQFRRVSEMGSVSAYDLTRLPNHHLFAQVMVDGMKSEAFSVKTYPPGNGAQAF